MKKIKIDFKKLLLLSATLFVLLFSSAFVSDGFLWRLPVELLLAAMPFHEMRNNWKTIIIMSLFPWGVSLYYIIMAVLLSIVPETASGLPESWNAILCTIAILQLVSGYLWEAYRYFSNMRNVMKSGTVWNYVSLRVGMSYSSVLLALLALLVPFYLFSSVVALVFRIVLLLLLTTLVAVLLYRRWNCCTFLLFRKLEDKIVECMQASVPDVSGHQYDVLFEDLYNRLIQLFEDEKLYLDDTLSINDLSRVLFTNKVYLSHAINQNSGKNFCQFINSFRIRYALDLFRKHPEFKVSDLSCQCGFHNVVSFSSAFRINMDCTPSEWCRAERARLRKMEK